MNPVIFKTKPKEKELNPILSSQVSIEQPGKGETFRLNNAPNEMISLNSLKKSINNKFA